jgi:hypothetical protein
MRRPERSLWPMPGPRRLGVGVVVVLAAALWLWTRSPPDPEASGREHAVRIHLRLSDGKLGSADELARLMDLERQLESAIDSSGAGELDGNEVGGGEFVVFTYGPDADALFSAVEPLLRGSPLVRDGFVVKRYGSADDPGAREARVDLGGGEARP